MAKMTAAQAAAWVLEKEGITQAFGVPGAAALPPCGGEQLLPGPDPAVQRGFDMDYCVQLAFDNINMGDAELPERGYGVDHVKVVEGLGCKAIAASLADAPTAIAALLD